MVTATAKPTNPDSIDVTITMTMPLGQWKKILETLNTESRWPEWDVARAIRDAITKLSASHQSAPEVAP